MLSSRVLAPVSFLDFRVPHQAARTGRSQIRAVVRALAQDVLLLVRRIAILLSLKDENMILLKTFARRSRRLQYLQFVVHGNDDDFVLVSARITDLVITIELSQNSQTLHRLMKEFSSLVHLEVYEQRLYMVLQLQQRLAHLDIKSIPHESLIPRKASLLWRTLARAVHTSKLQHLRLLAASWLT
jgi:hypothetical protein